MGQNIGSGGSLEKIVFSDRATPHLGGGNNSYNNCIIQASAYIHTPYLSHHTPIHTHLYNTYCTLIYIACIIYTHTYTIYFTPLTSHACTHTHILTYTYHIHTQIKEPCSSLSTLHPSCLHFSVYRADPHQHYIVFQSLKYEQIDYIFIWLLVSAPLL